MVAINQCDSRNFLALGIGSLLFVLCFAPAAAVAVPALSSLFLQSVFDIDTLLLFGKSVLLSLAVSLTDLIIGGVLAYVLLRVRLIFRFPLLALFTIPLFIPSYIHALSWSRLLIDAGNTEDIVITYWVLTASYYPVALLLACLGLLRWDRRFQEAAELYTSPQSAWWGIQWRFLRSYLLLAGVLIFFLVFSDFSVPDLFQVHVYSTEIFIQLSAYLDTEAAIIASLPPLILGGVILVGVIRVLRRMQLGLPDGRQRFLVLKDAGLLQWPLLLLALLLLFVLVLLPLGNLVALVGSPGVIVKALTMTWQDMLVSVVISILATLVALGLGVFVAYAVSRQLAPGVNGFRFLSLMMLILPAALLALGYINLWNQGAMADVLYSTGIVLVVALGVRALPICTESMNIAWRHISPFQEQAVYMISGSPFAAFMNVLLPQIKNALLVTGLLIFIFLFNEVSMYVLLAPPGISTLPLRIFSTVHYGPDSLVAAMCLLQITILSVPGGILFWFSRRYFRVFRNRDYAGS